MARGATSPAIVVAVDGSASGVAAVRWAAREAVMRRVALTVVHGVDEPAVPLGAASASDEVREIAESCADRVLCEALAAAHDEAGAEIDVDAIRLTGKAGPLLIDASKWAELIAVGCHGSSGRHRRTIGSTGMSLLHHAHCPVVVVHDEVSASVHTRTRPVLVAIDGSRPSLLAAATAFTEASWRGVDLLALHVCKDDAASVGVSTSRRSFLESDAEALLHDSVAGLQQQYPEVAVHLLVRFAAPVRQILNQAERAQLVVVGSHGRGTVSGALLGSVSAAVANQAHVPVLVTRGGHGR